MRLILVLAGITAALLGAVAAMRSAAAGFRPAKLRRAGMTIAGGIITALIGAGVATPESVPGRSPRQTDSPARQPNSRQSPPVPAPTAPVTSSPSVQGPEQVPSGIPSGAQAARVTKNVDGDTIWVSVTQPGGRLPAAPRYKVRLLEIDTPETNECFFKEASEFATGQLPVDSTVYLLADQAENDRFGRSLRYVWTQDGVFYNEAAVLSGYARAVLYEPNDRYIQQMRVAETEARTGRRGMWGACTA